ncbi:calcium-binding mitochondrial carrier protein Aralar2 isoform X2 [Trifolium pratense]|uniref:calcium-binding mitochondrial carrier protein Aralar2 isoform X2 n=1 Tax=Trifolium pratense TaxID=57577 RepID=UPI000842B623|nr:calcium-binding mitochondrial carrier protein Aralar2 isoform X2 [Trifolium pratense]
MEDLSRNQIFALHGITGTGSIALATALTYPLDTIKVLTQVGSIAGKELNANQVVLRVLSVSGNKGLFSGFGWLAFGRVFGTGARFGVYEILTAYCKDGREDNYVSASEALLAGMVAGATETFISSPFELIKLRMQVAAASYVPSSNFALEEGARKPLIARLLNGCYPDKRSLNQYVGLMSTLTTKNTNITGDLLEYPWAMTGSGRPPSVCNVRRPLDIISLEGWNTLWRGLRSGIVRDSVFGGVFFSSWQFLHQIMLDWKAAGMNPQPRLNQDIPPLSPLAVTLAAGFSGSVAAAASHGFDTARSRSQCTVLPKYVSMERKLLKWKQPGNRFQRYTGIHPSDRNILFRGLGLRMARSGVASFMIVGSYLFVVDHLASSLT